MIQARLVPLQIGNALCRLQIVDLCQSIQASRANFVEANEFNA